MKDLRRQSITGIYESNEDDLVPVSIHFSEWWNGEGMTFDVNNQKHIALHSDELHALCVIAIATEMVNWEQCKEDAKQLVEKSAEREEALQAFIAARGLGK